MVVKYSLVETPFCDVPDGRKFSYKRHIMLKQAGIEDNEYRTAVPYNAVDVKTEDKWMFASHDIVHMLPEE